MATERRGERRGERGTDARVLRALDIRSERRKFWEEVLRLARLREPVLVYRGKDEVANRLAAVMVALGNGEDAAQGRWTHREMGGGAGGPGAEEGVRVWGASMVEGVKRVVEELGLEALGILGMLEGAGVKGNNKDAVRERQKAVMGTTPYRGGWAEGAGDMMRVMEWGCGKGLVKWAEVVAEEMEEEAGLRRAGVGGEGFWWATAGQEGALSAGRAERREVVGVGVLAEKVLAGELVVEPVAAEEEE